MMRSLICFALKEEAAPFRKIAAGKSAMVQTGISILLIGIGRFSVRADRVNDYSLDF
jgi:hypothetical protein